ncbi:MAG: CPXCG motif-containing cysteine-rich protein [Cryomorphaceae bacterium]|nr:CPXCG motif-containing cysteine-rich protein [Cryomorphaceae bacterium]
MNVQCPHCWELQDIMVDPMQRDGFVQDCEVCCHPIRFIPFVDEHGEVIGLESEPES